jgi:hypothetical protein
MRKLRYALTSGDNQAQSGWRFGGDENLVAHFSQAVLAGAGSVYEVAAIIPVASGFTALGSPDPLPGVLTVASGQRQVGAGKDAVGQLVGVQVLKRAGAGGVYDPGAGVSVKVSIVSAVANADGITDVTAAFDLHVNNVNVVDTIALAAAPAERQILSQQKLASVVAGYRLFQGDQIIVALTAGGALDVRGNQLAVMIEVG